MPPIRTAPTDPVRFRFPTSRRSRTPTIERPQWYPRPLGYAPYRWTGVPRIRPLPFEPVPPVPPSGVDSLLQEDGFRILQETGFGILLGAPPGPFSVDFSLYPDGAVPEDETYLRDYFLDDPANQDEMGISNGRLAVVEFRGPDQAFSSAGAGGGRRGLLWRNTKTLTDDVWGSVQIPDQGGSGLVGSSAVLHINRDSEYLGVGAWFIPPPFSWIELGLIGYHQEDFTYLELAPGLSGWPEPGDDIKIRSVGGRVSLEWNGVTVCGPCDLPPDIAFSPVHGVQMDVAADADENVGIGDFVEVGSDSTPLTERPTPTTPAIGTAVETASATTINVPYPAGISAGNSLYAIVATKNGGTVSASGWTGIFTSFGVTSGIGIRVLRKTATGSESGSLTVTKSTAGVMAGVMLRAIDDRVPQLTGQANGSASTSLPAPALTPFGPRRTFVWVAATAIDTNITGPTGFTPLSTGVAGGQAIRLYVSVAVGESHADWPGDFHNAYTFGTWPSQVGSAASSTQSAVGTLTLNPAFV